MIAVIFEVTPTAEGREDYLKTAAQLRAQLQEISGFIALERFQSLADSEKILSLSFWEDEDAITRWRNLEEHRMAQSKGRSALFIDYRIRVAKVERDYSLHRRELAPIDSNRHFSD